MRNLSIMILALGLAACGTDKKDEGAGRAAGEILPASVSDTMIPLDTVRSQPPLAPQVQSAGKAAATDAATEAPEGEAAVEAPAAEPAPAATPAG